MNRKVVGRNIVHLCILITCILQTARGQMHISENGGTADPSAAIDIQSNNKGILIPRLSAAERLAMSNPSKGLLIFETSTTTFWLYNGSNWDHLIQEYKTELSDADGDTKIMLEKMPDEDIIRYDLKGEEMMAMTFHPSGSLGPVLYLKDIDQNTFVGAFTGESNAGNNNSFLGYKAGWKNSSGAFNTFAGFSTGENNLTGNHNTYMGFKAGFSQPEGSENTYIGSKAGQLKIGGSSNLIVGTEAGSHASSASGNVFIGYQAGKNHLGSNKLFIANSSTLSPLIYGDFSQNQFRVNGSFKITNIRTNGNWISGDGDDEGIFVNQNNRVGIGNTPLNNDLHVHGNVKVNGKVRLRDAGKYFAIGYDRPVSIITLTVNAAGQVDGGSANSSYVESIVKQGTGNYKINFVSGTFTKAPISSISAFKESDSNNHVFGHIVSSSAASVVVQIKNANGFNRDAKFTALIVGEI